MKIKTLLRLFIVYNEHIKDYFRIMRLSLFMLLLCVFQLMATNTDAQNAKIKVSKEVLTVRQLIDEIETQTDYLILFRNLDVDTDRFVHLDGRAGKISTLLDKAFAGTGVHYEFENKYILLSRRNNEKATSMGQQSGRKITGIVLDEKGEPVIGANIIEKGTTNGTTTDIDGRFSLELSAQSVLQVSYVGFDSQEVPVGSYNTLNIRLKENTSALDEVVVVGYGVQRKKLVTGAIVQVKGSVIEKQNTSNIFGALQSQAPGINISKTSGQPGQESKVSIRGVGTIGNSAPLYVVDGIVRSSINDLDPAIIESIDVLKDAASAAIYGARAANGVILVTTKKGVESKPTITYNGYLGWANVYKKIPMLNAKQYAEMITEGCENSERALPDFSSLVPRWNDIQGGAFNGTDWFSEAQVHSAPTQKHSIALRGGNSSMVYSSGFSYFTEEGTIGAPVQASYDRYTFFINSEVNVIKNDRGRTIAKIGENVSYAYYTNNGISTGGFFGNPIIGFFRTSPFLPNEVTEDSAYNFAIPWNSQEYNPIGYMVNTQGYGKNSNHKFNGNAYLTIEPIKNLVYRGNFGVNVDGNFSSNYSPVYNLSTSTIRTEDGTSQSMTLGLGWTFENTLRYSFSMKEHDVDVLIGQSVESTGGKLSAGMNGSNINNIFGDPLYAYLNNTKSIVEGKTSLSGYPLTEYKLMSYFGRLNYTFKDKYLLTAIIRSDGSSNFAPDKRWGYFPSVSAGWILTHEAFIKDHIDWLDFLKIRASWGVNGNQSITPFQYLSTIAFDSNSKYVFNSDKKTSVTGGYANILPNPDVTWERSEQTDFGFDANFLDSRLRLSFDWYKKVTKDWLVEAPILASYGTNAPYINGGDIENKGVEIALNWNDDIQGLKYGVGLNLSTNKNQVIRIANAEGIIHGPINSLFGTTPEFVRAEVGYPIGYFWGFKTAGVFQDQEEIDQYKNSRGEKIMPNARPGDLVFVDLNGDGVFNGGDEDKGKIGDPNPEVTVGLSINLEYKGFDLSLISTGVFGVDIAQSYRNWSASTDNFTLYDYENRWTGPGTSNVAPKLYYTPSVNDTYISDRYIKKGDYWRISNLTLGYDFKKIWQSAPLEQFRFYVSANNLLTITGYEGMDPDVGWGEPSWAKGMDVGFYPTPRVFMFGLSVTY